MWRWGEAHRLESCYRWLWSTRSLLLSQKFLSQITEVNGSADLLVPVAQFLGRLSPLLGRRYSIVALEAAMIEKDDPLVDLQFTKN